MIKPQLKDYKPAPEYNHAITREYSNLRVTSLNPEQHAKTCNYWYLVTENNSSYTAFRELSSLMEWLYDRGLELTETLPTRGEWSTQPIKGKFFSKCHMSYDEFYGVDAIGEVKIMSNGDYTLGLLSVDKDGLTTEHYLNPNKKHRPIFDYTKTNQEQG